MHGDIHRFCDSSKAVSWNCALISCGAQVSCPGRRAPSSPCEKSLFLEMGAPLRSAWRLRCFWLCLSTCPYLCLSHVDAAVHCYHWFPWQYLSPHASCFSLSLKKLFECRFGVGRSTESNSPIVKYLPPLQRGRYGQGSTGVRHEPELRANQNLKCGTNVHASYTTTRQGASQDQKTLKLSELQHVLCAVCTMCGFSRLSWHKRHTPTARHTCTHQLRMHKLTSCKTVTVRRAGQENTH